jgi:hypothetical protein
MCELSVLTLVRVRPTCLIYIGLACQGKSIAAASPHIRVGRQITEQALTFRQLDFSKEMP